MEDPAESTKRLEMHVKRVSSVRVGDEKNPSSPSNADANNLVSDLIELLLLFILYSIPKG